MPDRGILLILILVFSCTLCFVLGVLFYAAHRKERLDLVSKIKAGGRAGGPIPKGSFFTFGEYLVNLLSDLGGRLKPKRESDLPNIQRKLLNAGYRTANSATIFIGLKAALALLLPLCAGFVAIFLSQPVYSIRFLAVLAILTLLGFRMPNILLHLKIKERKEELIRGFADAVDLMVVCVEAGMGLDAAINQVSEEMKISNKTISDELKLLNLELRAGKSRPEAMRNLAVRTDLEEVRTLVALLLQTEKFGTGVANALRVHSDGIRTNRYQNAEEMAAKLPVKLLFPLIIFIFPSLFVTVLGPALIKLLRVLNG